MQCHLVPIVVIHGMADFAVGKHGMARVYVATTIYTSTHAVTIYLVYWPMNPPPMAMRQNLTIFILNLSSTCTFLKITQASEV